MDEIAKNDGGIFEQIRRTTSSGVEFWHARDLQELLGYDTWENFEQAIMRAREACGNSGVAVDTQFRETTKLVNVGSGARRNVRDFFLSRYACYLIAINGDPAKAKVANAQSYFTVQTRRMEIIDNAMTAQSEEEQRLDLREKVREAATALNSAPISVSLRSSPNLRLRFWYTLRRSAAVPA